MARATKAAKTAARSKSTKPGSKSAKRSVDVKDLPPQGAARATTRRIVNVRALASGISRSSLPASRGADRSGGQMAKAKKKATTAKSAKAKSTKAKKPVAVKNLGGKAKSKRGVAAVRRRVV